MKFTTAFGGIVAGLAFSAAPVLAQSVTLTLGHAVFESHPLHDAAARFADAVDKRSNGDMKIDIFPARQMGDVKELMEGVQLGTVDMTVNSSSALATLDPAVDAFQLPYVMETYEDFARMAVSPEAQAIMDNLGSHGMIGLGLYEGGQRHFLTTGDAVATMEDFGGLKTRVAPTELFLDIWKATGVNPTPMAYGEVYSGLETGTIDAVEINLTSIQSEGLFDAAKNVTLMGHYFWPGMLLINKAVFDGMTEDQQAILREAAAEVVEPQVMAVKAYDEELKVKLAEEGVSLTEASEALKADLREAWKPVLKKYSDRDPLIADFVEAATSGD
ncbi:MULTISPECIES: TRAP transporter substrate-binding protein [Shimia]|uniref:TRAP transporter substrate-binding protein n=1 Tax=Shimia TaxID=573139 RepID=UPI001FB2B131|nr:MULTISPECIES: TRAP transporter substrate-binding protein [Shimia]MDV4145380.1 TRAP transporter substrate-binding protein [Shimia sp. FJ5]